MVGSNPSTVDEVGAGLGCAVMDWHKRDIVVAREEAVYVCGVEGRGTCYAYEGTLFQLVHFTQNDTFDILFLRPQETNHQSIHT